MSDDILMLRVCKYLLLCYNTCRKSFGKIKTNKILAIFKIVNNKKYSGHRIIKKNKPNNECFFFSKTKSENKKTENRKQEDRKQEDRKQEDRKQVDRKQNKQILTDEILDHAPRG